MILTDHSGHPLTWQERHSCFVVPWFAQGVFFGKRKRSKRLTSTLSISQSVLALRLSPALVAIQNCRIRPLSILSARRRITIANRHAPSAHAFRSDLARGPQVG